MVKLVGILNITPDSFSDGGKYIDPLLAIAQAELLFSQGASIVDIGAESTKPGASSISQEEEWSRLEPVLEYLIPKYPNMISVDSYRPEPIRRAFHIGPIIINDVTGLNNPDMVNLVVSLKPHMVIVSHLLGTDIQQAHQLVPVSTVEEVRDDLLDKAKALEDSGISKLQIILDPGIGFGKPASLNKQLLDFARYVPGYQVMIGYSRKRFLGESRMEIAPNLEAGRRAVDHGADFLRVHDVAGHSELMTPSSVI